MQFSIVRHNGRRVIRAVVSGWDFVVLEQRILQRTDAIEFADWCRMRGEAPHVYRHGSESYLEPATDEAFAALLARVESDWGTPAAHYQLFTNRTHIPGSWEMLIGVDGVIHNWQSFGPCSPSVQHTATTAELWGSMLQVTANSLRDLAISYGVCLPRVNASVARTEVPTTTPMLPRSFKPAKHSLGELFTVSAAQLYRSAPGVTVGLEAEYSYLPDPGEWDFRYHEDGSVPNGGEYLLGPETLPGIIQPIQSLCAIAQEVGAEVGTQAGLHIHTGGLPNDNYSVARVIALFGATQPAWAAAVPRHRRENNYCNFYSPSYVQQALDYFKAPTREKLLKVVSYNYGDMQSWHVEKVEKGGQDRYRACNVNSAYCHGTYELRLPNATLSETQMAGWALLWPVFCHAAIKGGLTIPSAALDMDNAKAFLADAFRKVAGGEALTSFLKYRWRKCGERICDEMGQFTYAGNGGL